MKTTAMKISATALAFSLLAAIPLAGTAQAYQCKTGTTQVETIGKMKTKAKANGRALWTTTVKNNYGLAWSVWDIASAKSQTCSHTGNNWYCVTVAKPCLYVVP